MHGVFPSELRTRNRVIQKHDLVVVYERFDNMKAVEVSEDGVFQNKWGMFRMKVRC